jgi:hypothetical protein
MNSTALATHTSLAFVSVCATTLVAFVSTHPAWPPDAPKAVSISAVTDNVGSTCSVLVGPTTYAGGSEALISAIDIVNSPSSSVANTLSVDLTNTCPLVMHVFAVSGSNVTGPPSYSFITDPGLVPSVDVVTQVIIGVLRIWWTGWPATWTSAV